MRRREFMLGAAGAVAAGTARAADWAPTRPVNFIVPLAPGSTADILARTMAEIWSARLGQPVTVDNRPAAGGVVAMEQIRNAAPDGQTFGLASQGTLVFNSYLTRSPRYDSRRDFAPVAMFSTVTNALVVPKTSPYRTAQELAEAARAQPQRLTYSSGGNGTSHHISMVLFNQVAKSEMTHVPYRGAPAGITAVMTGEVASGCYNIPTVLAQIRAGELRPLGVTSATRSAFLPEVPSLQEQGFAGYELTTWMGMVAPARTPEAAIARMAAETYRALDDQAVWAKLERQGFETMPHLDPAGFSAFLDAEMRKWGPVIQASGAVAD